MTPEDKDALLEAVRRFPRRLKQWRQHGLTSKELHEVAPQIVAEYRLIIREREKANAIRYQKTTTTIR